MTITLTTTKAQHNSWNLKNLGQQILRVLLWQNVSSCTFPPDKTQWRQTHHMMITLLLAPFTIIILSLLQWNDTDFLPQKHQKEIGWCLSWHLPNFIWMQAHKCQIKLECLGFNILMPRTAITSIEKALPLTGPSIWVNIFCILTSKVETKWQGARKLTWIFQCLSPGPVSLRNNWFEYHIWSKLIQ